MTQANVRRPRFNQHGLAIPCGDALLAGVVAFYAIVHFSPPALRRVLAEMSRVLQPGGRLLLAFHIGHGSTRVEEFLGRPVSMDFAFFLPAVVAGQFVEAGFVAVEVIERDPYPYPDVEYPSRRAYLFAHKPERDGEAAGSAEPTIAVDPPKTADR